MATRTRWLRFSLVRERLPQSHAHSYITSNIMGVVLEIAHERVGCVSHWCVNVYRKATRTLTSLQISRTRWLRFSLVRERLPQSHAHSYITSKPRALLHHFKATRTLTSLLISWGLFWKLHNHCFILAKVELLQNMWSIVPRTASRAPYAHKNPTRSRFVK
jgi:hypothetical protein